MKNILIGLFVLVTYGAFSETVTISTARTVSSIPLLALEGQSFAGDTLSVPLFDDHPLAMAELLAGKSQMLQTGSSLGIKNAQSGGPLVQIATAVWDVSGLVSLDPALTKLSDFQGKSIVLPLAGGPLDVQFQTLLREAGLQGKITLEYAEPAQAVALLLQHRVDGACLPEPLVSRLVVLNQAKELFTFAQAWAPGNQGDGRAPQVSLLAKRDWAATHEAFLQAFLPAYRTIIADVQAHPDTYAKQFSSALGLPAAIVERGLAHTTWSLPTASDTRDLFSSYLKRIGDAKGLPASFFWPTPLP